MIMIIFNVNNIIIIHLVTEAPHECVTYVCNNNNNIIIIIINRHFKDAQLTKVVTKAPAVTTIQDNKHKQQTTLS